ncbi:MAG TPA: hypothetical protein VGC29_06090 [Flavisolibacter sp.]
MLKLYTTTLLIAVILIGSRCSKDFLKSYEDRIEGNWDLNEVRSVGFGGDTGNLPFREGSSFVFTEGGGLSFTDVNGEVYSGSWDIERNYNNDQQVRSLHLSVINFTTQQVRSEIFEEIQFTGTNKFKGFIHQELHTYVFHFER